MNVIKRYFPNVVCLVCTILYCVDEIVHGMLFASMSVVSLAIIFVFFQVLLVLLGKKDVVLSNGEKVLSVIVGAVVSQFLTVGNGLMSSHSFDYCFGSLEYMGLWLLLSLCYGYLAYYIINYIVFYIQNAKITSSEGYCPNLKLWFAVILFVKLMMIVVFYPCAFDYDSAKGLWKMLDPNEIICDHNPYVVQMIHAAAFKIGAYVGEPSMGFALLAIITDVITSFVLIYGIKVVSYLRIEKKWMLVFCFVLAFFPLYPYLSHFVTKDGLFSYAFLLYCISVFHIVLTKRNVSKLAIVAHAFGIIGMCLFRQQGLYVVIVVTMFLFVVYYKSYGRLLVATIPALCLVLFVKLWFIPSQGVTPTSKAESYGMLFQQTALCLKKYPNDVSIEDRNVINRILPVDSIVNLYDPIITDPVKWTYKYSDAIRTSDRRVHYIHVDRTNESRELSDYRKVWLKYLFRHPMCYLEANLNICGGFFCEINMIYFMITGWQNMSCTKPEYAFRQHDRAMSMFTYFFEVISPWPIISWPFDATYYLWITLLLLGILFYRKKIDDIVFVLPIVLSICVLFICPAAQVRYAYPILIVFPFLLIYLLGTNNRSSIYEK